MRLPAKAGILCKLRLQRLGRIVLERELRGDRSAEHRHHELAGVRPLDLILMAEEAELVHRRADRLGIGDEAVVRVQHPVGELTAGDRARLCGVPQAGPESLDLAVGKPLAECDPVGGLRHQLDAGCHDAKKNCVEQDGPAARPPGHHRPGLIRSPRPSSALATTASRTACFGLPRRRDDTRTKPLVRSRGNQDILYNH